VSLQRRVVIGFVAIAAVLVVANVALASTFRSFLLNRTDHQLATNGVPFGNRGPGVAPDDSTAGPPTEFFAAIGDPDSGVLTRVGYTTDERPAPKLETKTVIDKMTAPGEAVKPFTTKAVTGGGKWRVIALVSPFDGGVRVLGISLDGLNETLTRVREIQILASLAVLAALGFVSWWMIRLGVHPIAAMAETAEQITGGDDLSTRVEHPDERTEAGRLGASFNAMLDRIQDAFRAREASEEKVRRFAADASHELRTPLTSIRGYAELYRAGGLPDDASLSDAMSRVESEARRMGLLVDELLQLARLDQAQAIERHDVDLAAIATDAVADARVVEPERPIELVVEPAVVHADEPALRQVMANLLANVRAHTAPSTPTTVTVRVNDGTAELAVADEGPGMREDVAAHVFERFYRADGARAHGGTGLGLAIVDSIARAHGGEASVTSAEGAGARFAVTLPLAEATATT